MGKVFNMVGGGGGSITPDLPIGSYINVTSDIGATIQCKKGILEYTKVVGEDSRLPSGYTKVEYIESTGNEYISVELTDSPNSTEKKYEIQCAFLETGIDKVVGTGNVYFGISTNKSSSYFICAPGANTTYSITDVSINTNKHKFVMDKVNRKFQIDDGTNYTCYNSTSNTGNIYIFGYSTSHLIKMRLYSYKLWNNGTLVRDYIPCFRNSDNVGGVYDLVNNNFVTTPTGAFTYPTTGTVSFEIHHSGTWNLTANKTGETELTDSVVVSADDTTYSKEMFWRLYLYNAGDECTSVTGGWTTSGYTAGASIIAGTKNATSMTIKGGGGSSLTLLGVDNSVDISNFTYLKINVNVVSTVSGQNAMNCRILPSKQLGSPIIDGGTSGTGEQIVTLPLSSVTTNCYIALFCNANSSYNTTVTEVWAE